MSGRDALATKFTKVLPGWLRRCGVHRAELGDAAQEALVAALTKLSECPEDVQLDDAGTRDELMRIVSNVALRVRRRAQREGDRYTSIDDFEVADVRDEEAWVEARVVVLEALENLDEPTRALIYAHEIEGRTNVEIAAALNLKEDAVEKRVGCAKQRLRAEIEHLERGRIRKNRREGLLLSGLGLDPFIDPFDRAVFGAMYEASGKAPSLIVQPKFQVPKLQNFLPPNLPTTALVGALALTPSSSPSSLAEAGETNVQRVKHVSSFDVPAVAAPSTYSLPSSFFVPRSSVTSTPSKGSEPSNSTMSTPNDDLNAGGSSKSNDPSEGSHQKPAPFVDIPSLYDGH